MSNPVPLHLSKILAGWDARKQQWVHHFSSLPSNEAKVTGDGSSFAQWLQANATGSVTWKVKSVFPKPSSEVSDRIALAKSGNVDGLQTKLDEDIVARLLDRDKLGRTILHAAAASGNLDVVRMLAARSSGWPVEFVPVKQGGLAFDGVALKSPLRIGTTTPMPIPVRKPGALPVPSVKSPLLSNLAGVRTAASGHGNNQRGLHTPESGSSPRQGWRTANTGKATWLKGVSRFKNMLNIRDRAGNTPLHLASSEGHIDVVEEMLGRGAEIEARNLAGRTALHVACMNNHLDVIAMLVSAGGSVRARDVEHRRPMDMTISEEVHHVLSETVGNGVAVRGGPTPFGPGDDDSGVFLNVTDRDFAIEEEEGAGWDPQRGVRKTVGTAGPLHCGARLPRIRPVTPVTDTEPTDPDEAEAQERRVAERGGGGLKKMAGKTVGWHGVEEDEEEEEGKSGRRNGVQRRVAVRSGWYRTNERHALQTTAQTLRSRHAGVDNVMHFEKKQLSVVRMLAEERRARERERRRVVEEGQGEGSAA